jgi:iron complex outermembrane recepter protein
MNEVTGTRALLCMVAAALCWTNLRGRPAHCGEPTVYSLHIASQPLDGALQEFSRQSGVQVIFFSRLTAGRRAPLLDGRYTIEAAMSVLLAGTKLTYRMINSRTLELGSTALGPSTGRQLGDGTYNMIEGARRSSSWSEPSVAIEPVMP